MSVSPGNIRVAIAAATFVVCSQAMAQTFVARVPPFGGKSSPPAEILGTAAVGERFCNPIQCVVFTKAPSERATLQAFQDRGQLNLELRADIRKVSFRNATWDGDLQAFDRDFPGKLELAGPGEPAGLYAILFKSFPQQEWLDALSKVGLTVIQPAGPAAYLVYGDRSAVASAASASYVYRSLEIPAGIKRQYLDATAPGDDDNPRESTVVLVDPVTDRLRVFLESASGRRLGAVSYRMKGLLAYTIKLSRADALFASRYPEVIDVTRNVGLAEPSDERSNRIVLGTYDTAPQPGTAWPTTLPTNMLYGSEYSYDHFLARNPITFPGFNLSNQAIGFLDTGIDDGFFTTGGSPTCPLHLQVPGGGCRLVFTTDLTPDFDSVNTRCDDRRSHGSAVTSVAAGYPIDRDTNFYAFTQGVAQGSRVAVSKMLRLYANNGMGQPGCDASGWRCCFAEGDISELGVEQRVRYSLVSMNTTQTVPDQGVAGPGIRIFNHSWNLGIPGDYEAASVILDQTARDPAASCFDFGPYLCGSGLGMLHVVAAGNLQYGDTGDRTITAPGLAKNVITVGATETYNPNYSMNPDQSGSSQACQAYNSQGYASNAHILGAFSRVGPMGSYKPDLVAPGTRSYGRYSSRTGDATSCPDLCYPNVASLGKYEWNYGTSYAAPVVAGIAAWTKEYLSATGRAPSPSTALLRAWLIAGSVAQVFYNQGIVNPPPSRFYGWGGASLETIAGATTCNSWFLDQSVVLTPSSPEWTKTLTVTDTTKPVTIVLVWTDPATTGSTSRSLLNDLGIYAGQVGLSDGVWFGNSFDSSGYSICYSRGQTFPPGDHANTVEKIVLPAPIFRNTISLTVHSESLTTNGLAYNGGTPLQQDFAVVVLNARDTCP